MSTAGTIDSEAFCRALMRADTEDEVIALLDEMGYWNDPAVWRYIGDNDNNWSTIGNQQSDPVAALAEKFVNSIDARLLNACLEAGTDPKGPNAPATMREAVAKYFEHAPNPKADHVGRVANWTDSEIREQARQLTVAATGKPNHNPCLSIADTGEGQTPAAVPHTFMSLDKRNKVDIPFVQGKYNMGGTGALYSCGRQKIQLLVTRRNPVFAGTGDPRAQDWAFTVTRREPTGARNPVCTYLAPVRASERPRHGEVLAFSADTMPLLPEASKEHRDAYHREVTYGSLIKLYEYDFPRTSDIIRTRGGLRQRIETHLPELALPVGVFECRPARKGAEGGSFFTPARGTATRLEQEKNADQLEFPPIPGMLNLSGFEIVAKAYAFRRVPGQKKRDGFLADYAQGAGVLYTVNGQTHARASNDFFRREAVDLDYLRDDLLVTVDCTAVDEITRADLFMNSRDRNRLAPLWKQLERMVERFLKQNDLLQQLASRRREEAIRERTEDDQALADLLGRVFKASPDLAKLLLGGTRLPAPFAKPGTGRRAKAKEFKGKRFPTYFHFDKLKAGEEHKRRAEVGRELRVVFTTDAEDNYFWRASQPGSMSVSLNRGNEHSSDVDAAMMILSAGVARWVCDLPADARVGDILTYDFEVTDPLRDEPFRNRLRIEVVPRSNHSGDGGKRRKRANDGEGDRDAQAGLSLPHVVPLKNGDAQWDEFNFDPSTALFVRRTPGSTPGGVGYDFFYNADNESLLRAQKEKPQDADLTKERFKCALVMVGLALIQETEVQRKPKKGEAEALGLEELILLTTRAVAPVLLPLIEFVGALSVEPK